MKTKQKILFVCLGNSCRSIMAEALARHFHPGHWEAASAGLTPLGYVVEETVQVLEEMGVNPEGLYSKGLKEVDLAGFQAIVNLTEYNLKRYVPDALRGRLINRPVEDPYDLDLTAYRRAREEIILLLSELAEDPL
ncbi:MAG: low molecular weight phosphatase family protein [Deltaproteobacteria bacterium]|nr:low molecular weight phosphatase family protein [Deltaproteobacteria bacterium]